MNNLLQMSANLPNSDELSSLRENIGTQSELNRRHESFDNTDIHHRFYENDVPMSRC